MKNKNAFYRKCPLCQCGEGKILRTITMNIPEEYRLPKSYDVVCCNECGFIFADTKAKQDNYKHYYEKCNTYSDVGRVKQNLYMETHTKNCNNIQKYCNKEDKILDIGCGNGGILSLLNKSGFSNLYGIDPSLVSIKHLREMGIKGEVGDIYTEVPLNLKHKMDFVICTALFEHLLDLELAIKRIKEYLKEEGKLYLTVPGIEGFNTFKNLIADYFNHEHINYFDQNALDYLMKKQGFDRISNWKEDNYIVSSTPPELVLSAVYVYRNHRITMNRNDNAESIIRDYFSWYEAKEQLIRTKIEKIIDSQKRIIVWGTGSSTMWLLDNFPKLRDKIEYYIDNNQLKVGTEIFGKKIYSPSILKTDQSTVLIICVMINSFEIIEQMKVQEVEMDYYILGE